MEEEKIWISWKIVTFEEKFVEHKGLLFPIIYHVKGIKNKEGELDLKFTKLNYKLCNETSFANRTGNFKEEVPLNELMKIILLIKLIIMFQIMILMLLEAF